jgi:hypothetical protein
VTDFCQDVKLMPGCKFDDRRERERKKEWQTFWRRTRMIWIKIVSVWSCQNFRLGNPGMLVRFIWCLKMDLHTPIQQK